jgi:uncharacterized protein YndB with AHSA1/START domain
MREQYGSPGLFSASLVQGVFWLAFLLSRAPPFRGMAAARRPFARNATKRFVNRLPNGKEVAFHGVYREIARPERVVNTEIFEEYPDVESLVTTVLTEERGKTRLTVTAWYPSAEVRDIVLKSGMDRGAALSYDRLEEVATGLGGS